MSTTTKRPICGESFDDGVCVNRWIEDGDGNLIRRCECSYRELTPDEARAAGIAATSGANPDAMRAALAIIREQALTCETFTANDVRLRMEIAQVPGPVVGAAFGQAVRDGLIRRDGWVSVPSSKENTHGHELKQWRSLKYQPGRRTA